MCVSMPLIKQQKIVFRITIFHFLNCFISGNVFLRINQTIRDDYKPSWKETVFFIYKFPIGLGSVLLKVYIKNRKW